MSKREPSIKLSKENGVHPVIPLCPYCGEPKNEIALTGAMGDRLAKKLGLKKLPMQMLLPGDYTPCDKCREKGVVMIGCDPVTRKPTGKIALVDRKVLDCIKDEEMRKAIAEKGVFMCDQAMLDAIPEKGADVECSVSS